jgi:SanA protein
MINGLKERGIPAEKIYPDFAGFRTFDSVFRAKYVFGQDSLTVISQKFHNERAVYIGQKLGYPSMASMLWIQMILIGSI